MDFDLMYFVFDELDGIFTWCNVFLFSTVGWINIFVDGIKERVTYLSSLILLSTQECE